MYSMCCKCAQCTNVSACTSAQFSDLETVLQAWELIHICLELSRSKTSSNYFNQTFSAVVTIHSRQTKADQLTLRLAAFEVSLPAQLLMTQR